MATLSDSFSLGQRGSKMHASRVGFISNASGERFALPGPAREDNQWTVRGSAFGAQDIVGKLVVVYLKIPWKQNLSALHQLLLHLEYS